MRHLTPIILGAALALLSACAPTGTTISRVEIGQRYEPTEQGYLGGKGAIMPTVIWNNPLPQAAGDWRTALTRYRPGTPLTFVPLEDVPEDQRRQRFVLLFAPPPGMVDMSLCSMDAPPESAQQGAGPFSWRAAYCVGKRTVNEAVGQLAAKPAPGADTMAPVLPELAISLFPLVNPHLKGERCLLPSC